jgi:hypothetical protein
LLSPVEALSELEYLMALWREAYKENAGAQIGRRWL